MTRTDLSHYFIYIVTSKTGVLYTGSTSDLKRRVYEHKSRRVPGFSKRYRTDRLVYFEETPSSRAMLEREREIKGWSRAKKIELIENRNPTWRDLAEEW